MSAGRNIARIILDPVSLAELLNNEMREKQAMYVRARPNSALHVGPVVGRSVSPISNLVGFSFADLRLVIFGFTDLWLVIPDARY